MERSQGRVDFHLSIGYGCDMRIVESAEMDAIRPAAGAQRDAPAPLVSVYGDDKLRHSRVDFRRLA